MQWSKVCHNFYQKHPSKIITKFNFSSLLSEASCGGVITPVNIMAGFCRAGGYPLNPQAVAVTEQSDHSLLDSSSSNPSAEPSLPSCHDSSGASAANDKPLGVSVTSCPGTALSDSASGICGSRSSMVAGPCFTKKQKQRFQSRYEEGFHVAGDQDYTHWLRLNHPDCPLIKVSENQKVKKIEVIKALH